MHNLNRDGFHRQTISKGRINYEPSSIDAPPIREVPATQGGFASFAQPVNGPKVRHRSETFADHYSQATLFWQSQTAVEQQHIAEALQFELGKVNVPAVRTRMLANLVNVDRELAGRVAQVLGMPMPPASPRIGDKRYTASPKLSMIARGNPTGIVSRQVAFLAADGVDVTGLQTMKAALSKAGATVKVLSTRLGALKTTGGGNLPVDHLIVNMPSIVFDAVCVFGGAANVAELTRSADAVHFVREAFKHAKPLAALAEGRDFLKAAGVPSGSTEPAGVSAGTDASTVLSSFMTDLGAHRRWERLAQGAMAA